jgi:hypothetical protein
MPRRRILAILACGRAARAHSLLGAPVLLSLLVWVAGVLLLADQGPERIGHAIGVVAAVYALLGVAPSTHDASHLWASAAGLLASQHSHLSYRTIAATISLFAALNKAISRSSLSGEILASSLAFSLVDLVPFAVPLAVLTIVVELALVPFVLSEHGRTWVLMLLFHAAILATVSVNVRTFWALVNYGFFLVWFWFGLSGRRACSGPDRQEVP